VWVEQNGASWRVRDFASGGLFGRKITLGTFASKEDAQAAIKADMKGVTAKYIRIPITLETYQKLMIVAAREKSSFVDMCTTILNFGLTMWEKS
jgi:hypothetical protein